MALLRADFYSNYLKRNVMLTAVIPVDKMEGESARKAGAAQYRTVYLLHGLFGRDVDWIDRTHVVETAEARDIALIMPSGEDGLYLNKPEIDEWHSKFISEELIEVTRHLFPLSSKREDTALAGISMARTPPSSTACCAPTASAASSRSPARSCAIASSRPSTRIRRASVSITSGSSATSTR